MATITIKNVPETTLKRFGNTVDFGEIKIIKKRRKDLTIRLEALRKDPDNTSYGPFDDVEEAINFLNRDYENSI